MCGIAGFFNMKNAENITFSEQDKAFLIKFLLSEITMETETRGRDATGYFTLFQDKNAIGLKHGIKASTFCTKAWDEGEFTFQNHLKLMEAYHNEVSPIATALSHCRAKTVGAETNNDNNHPIYVGDLVGIHNGCLSNHSKIYSNIKDDIERIGAVDSEMIVQLLWLATEKGKKEFDDSMIKYVTEKLDGSYAFICLDKKNPNSVFFIRDMRPIEFVYLRQAGILLVVSEKKFFESAIKKYNWLNFYGINTPETEYEHYTFPDDKGFILDLNTKIAPETKIENFLGNVVSISKTTLGWKEPAICYGGRNNSYCNRQEYSPAYNQKSIPKALPGYYKDNKDYSHLNGNTTKQENQIVKKVETIIKKDEKNENQKEQKSQLRVVTWNKERLEFDFTTKNKKDIYNREIESRETSRYTIFKNTKSLAAKLNLEECVVATLTEAQLANRVSKMIYEENIAGLADEVKRLKNNENKSEEKAQKARAHIITLRGIINAVVRILSKSYKPGQVVLTGQEAENMGCLWKFLYSNRKWELKDTSLGIFIISLKKSYDKKQKLNHT